MQKKVLAIHDISCVGRCSLTVALPIISAGGIETSVLPTAVLSTHTGEFSGYTHRELTDDFEAIMAQWENLGLEFDAIYTGYLGSEKQIELVCKFIDEFSTPDTTVIVDPAMADDGKMYTLFNDDFANKMKLLVKKADIIVPNITEAAILTASEYVDGVHSRKYIESLCKKLTQLAPKAVLTGVSLTDNTLGCAVCDVNSTDFIECEKTDGFFYGTGDVFASVLVTALLNSFSLVDAAALATDFTTKAVERTKMSGRDLRYGVDFESGICELCEVLKENKQK